MSLRSSEALWRRCSAAQTALAEANTSRAPDRRINFRIGVHIGDVMVRLGICLARSEHSRAVVPTITAATWFPPRRAPPTGRSYSMAKLPSDIIIARKAPVWACGTGLVNKSTSWFPKTDWRQRLEPRSSRRAQTKEALPRRPVETGSGRAADLDAAPPLKVPRLESHTVTPSLRNSFRLLANPQALTHYPPRGYSSGGLHVQEGELSACGNTCRGAFIVIAAAGCSRLHRRTATVLHRRRASPLRI